jgi:hypothetical protein
LTSKGKCLSRSIHWTPCTSVTHLRLFRLIGNPFSISSRHTLSERSRSGSIVPIIPYCSRHNTNNAALAPRVKKLGVSRTINRPNGVTTNMSTTQSLSNDKLAMSYASCKIHHYINCGGNLQYCVPTTSLPSLIKFCLICLYAPLILQGVTSRWEHFNLAANLALFRKFALMKSPKCDVRHCSYYDDYSSLSV